MRPRDFAWLLTSALAGIALIYLLRLALGYWPHIVISSGIILIAVGLGMVCARFSRLGPFEGELGAPWFENDLNETLAWEYDRAARYGRIVSVIVLRQRPGATEWDAVMRAVDRVIGCRNNWMILILPETTREGAQSMLRRLSETGAVSRAAVLQLPLDLDSRASLTRAILGAMREDNRPSSVHVIPNAGADSLPQVA